MVREPFLVLNRDLRVLLANPAYYQVFKAREDNTVGGLVYELHHGQWDIPELRNLPADVLAKPGIVNDLALTYDDPVIGTRRFLLEAKLVESNRLILLAIRETPEPPTTDEAAHRQLEVERRQFYDLFMQAPVAIAVFRGPSHIVEFANPAVCAFWGRSLEQVIGKPAFETLPETAGQGYEELLNGVLTTGIAYHAHEVSVNLPRNGRQEKVFFSFVYQPLYELDGRIRGIAVIANEITEQVEARVRMEELVARIRQQAKTFDTALSALSDFVYTFDRSGRFTYSNRPLLDLLGITLEEIIGKSFHELPYPVSLATLLQQQISEVVATGKPVTDETSYTNPAGHVGYYEYIFMPIFDHDGKVTLVAGSTRDITSRKELERQKDEFMGVVSHELRTPVTSIKAFGQVLQRRFAKGGDQSAASLLGKMDAQINRLTTLIDDLLDVTKIEGGKLQFNQDDFYFDDLVDEVIEETQRTTDKHRIERIGTAKGSVFGDRHRIGQVVTNLLTNAIKYSPNADRIVVNTRSDSDDITLCVQDFGIGIPQDRQPRLFERFYRVLGNETIPGIGLGLYISAEIIRRQGGDIWMESAEGKGSTFCFKLPIQETVDQQETGRKR
jgi:PAS domain S-box-containing protein